MMIKTSTTIRSRIRAVVGSQASIDESAAGIPSVAPHSAEVCALLLQAAHEERWTVRLAGKKTWIPGDAPAQLELSSARLNDVESIRQSDLVATVQAGVTGESLISALRDRGTWWPVDHAGQNRTIGSILAAGTAGPLAAGFGGVRNHVLGLTMVLADGRIVKCGGQVVKNVAGYDLTKLAIGSFGTFGFIASANLRLRAIPMADITLTAVGPRDDLLLRGHAVVDAGLLPSAMQIFAPAAPNTQQWSMAIRLIGSDPSVAADRTAIAAASDLNFDEMTGEDAVSLWRHASETPCKSSTTLRIAAVITDLQHAMDLVSQHLDEVSTTVNILGGTVHWSGNTKADAIRRLRVAAAEREMPVTLERAPWETRRSAGHFGAYREGIGKLMDSLRQTFDPREILVVPVTGSS